MAKLKEGEHDNVIKDLGFSDRTAFPLLLFLEGWVANPCPDVGRGNWADPCDLEVSNFLPLLHVGSHQLVFLKECSGIPMNILGKLPAC